MEKFFFFMSFYEQHQQAAPAQSNNSDNNNGVTPMSLDGSSFARVNQQPTFALYEPQRASVSFMPNWLPPGQETKMLDALQQQSQFTQVLKLQTTTPFDGKDFYTCQLMAKGIHLEADNTTQEFKLYNKKGGLYIRKAVRKNNVFVLDFTTAAETTAAASTAAVASTTAAASTLVAVETTAAASTLAATDATATAPAPIASSSSAPTPITDTTPTPTQQLIPAPRKVHRSTNITASFYSNSDLYRRSPGHRADESLWHQREALAASDAADVVPELCMIDNVVRAFAEHIGRSSVHYQKFHELQRIFCQTNLEAHGIHEVRWLSRGEAVQRLLDVLPAAVVVLKDYKKELYEVVTSFKFHWLIRFLADVLWELNTLNKRFQQRQVDVTLVAHIVEQTRMRLKTRYSLCDPAHHFGNGDKMQLPEFIKRHQAIDKREMKAEGVDRDGNPVYFVYELHERRLPGHETDGDVTACVELSIKFVSAVDAELEWRMRDLNLLEGTKLFQTASYVSDDSKRVETFKKWLGLLHKLHNHKLPGKP
ncbi:unnamed protein product [Closterium sp. NIES-53]